MSISYLKTRDPLIFDAIEREHNREREGLELIASENYVSQAVLEAQGSILTHKYAEGYPGKRYYGGCECVDQVEALAIERVCKLFHAQAANVQPHSGSQANMGVYFTLLSPGDSFMGMDLSQGGHLTHGSPVNFSGKLFRATSYGVDPKTHLLDYDWIRKQVQKEKPKMLMAGASAYPRVIDFEILGQIAREQNIHFVVDMAHIAGLVAAGLHPSPVPHATYVTSTTHKTLRGPRGGFILSHGDHIKAVNSAIFPGIQGGPLMHIIAAKAVGFLEAMSPEFNIYQQQVLRNSKALAEKLMELGFKLVTDGTDNHLLLIDLSQTGDGSITGKDAEYWLDQAGLTVNKNTVPNEKRSPFITSGIRIGTPAMTTRGLRESEMNQIANWIYSVLQSKGEPTVLKKIKQNVKDLCSAFPIP